MGPYSSYFLDLTRDNGGKSWPGDYDGCVDPPFLLAFYGDILFGGYDNRGGFEVECDQGVNMGFGSNRVFGLADTGDRTCG